MTVFSRRHLFVSAGALSFAALVGCGPSGSGTESVVPMGSTVAVGNLKYTVFQTEWREALDGTTGPRSPQHRFLLVTLSVENTGTQEAGIPLLRLVDSSDAAHEELSNGEGVQDWLGYLRTAQPGASERGVILFDVPPAGYKLRVSSGGDLEDEKTAVIDIPYRVDIGPPTSSPGSPGGL